MCACYQRNMLVVLPTSENGENQKSGLPTGQSKTAVKQEF